MHVIAAKAVAFKEAMEPEFKRYQQQVIKNAQTMAARFMERGVEVVSGGTDNHLFLVSLINKGITGKDLDAALGRANITVNKNAVPNDPQSPFVTSGIRIGTPSVTTRGFREEEAAAVAGWICDVIDNMGDEGTLERVKGEAKSLVSTLPHVRRRPGMKNHALPLLLSGAHQCGGFEDGWRGRPSAAAAPVRRVRGAFHLLRIA